MNGLNQTEGAFPGRDWRFRGWLRRAGAISAGLFMLAVLPASPASGRDAGLAVAAPAPDRPVRLDARRIARQVFDPRSGAGLGVDPVRGAPREPARGVGTGFFVMMPDGRIHSLGVNEEKRRMVDLGQEAFRLSIRIKLRQRARLMEQARAGRDVWLAGRRDRQRRTPALADFFADMALEPGDAVVTGEGVYVFRGAEGFPYTARDFAPLAPGAGPSRAQGRIDEQRLRALQRSLRRD